MARYRIGVKPGGTQLRIDQIRSQGVNAFPNSPIKIKEGSWLEVDFTGPQHDRFVAQDGRVARIEEVVASPVTEPAKKEPAKRARA